MSSSGRSPLPTVNERDAEQPGAVEGKGGGKASMLRGRNAGTAAEEQPHIGNYRLLKTIGKGNFAKVKLARHVLTGKEVAVKIIDKTQLNSSSLQKLFREVRIMKVLNHPNIVKLFEVIETEKTLGGGEVFDYLVAHGRMKEKEARAKFRQIVSAVQYCHQKFIVHRDLKELRERVLRGKYRIPFYMSTDCENLLKKFLILNPTKRGTLEDLLGTPNIILGPPACTAAGLSMGGCWVVLGVSLVFLGSHGWFRGGFWGPMGGLGSHGWFGVPQELRERVLRGKYRIPFYMSTDCENLLKKFLILNPTKRGTLEQIMKDRWMNVGHEDDELKPYMEPVPDYKDPRRTELMVSMGYTREEIQESLVGQKYNEVMATYLLLDHKSSEVGTRGEEGGGGGRRAGSTAKVPPSPLPGLERSKGTPSPSTVSAGWGGRGDPG
ncbi:serine/threonine-protein kinase MARK2-like, partial [Pyrgilauda ruficollis]|uniref:serine/threonine-protein kinase MARK2-like n=1 Tax=Pyrgilauda ruficollis TaxID=221976 RepID=UPI001B866962